MEGVTSTFKEGLILFYTLVSGDKSIGTTDMIFSMTGFHPCLPLPGDQDVPKHLGLEKDEEPVRRDE